MTTTLHTRIARLVLVGGLTLGFASSSHAAGPSPRVYQIPEDAVEALVAGLKAADRKQLVNVLGGAAKEWIFTGDTPTDQKVWGRFLAAYDAQHSVVEESDGHAVLIVGKERYPFPFPILRVAGGWRFDPAQGKEEILNRRVGQNELSTIEVLKEIVAAQQEYVLKGYSGDPVPEYATRLASTPGKRDGLYWPSSAGQPESPLGPLIAEAQAQGYDSHTQPYHGYRFSMLKGQGAAAPGGAQTYTVNGQTLGYGVLAYPSKYGVTGVKSFIVNQEGVIYEKDLGRDTAKIAAKTQLFNPDAGWTALGKK